MLRAHALRKLSWACACACLLLLLAGCQKAGSTGRDWTAYPAIVEVDAASPIYAVSDVHGAYDRLVSLLALHHIIQRQPGAPADVKWAAGPAVLVVAGDLFDKGPGGVEVMDLLRALTASAAAAGGRVIVMLGNHEAEFLVDPLNDKATESDGIATQLRAAGLDPSQVAAARGTDPRGQWLRTLPFAARVGRWLFAHAGDTHGRSIAELERVLRLGVESYDYNYPEIVGETSILESSGWASDDASVGARYASAAGAAHIVFGHDPGALGDRGAIAEAQSGALFRIDCGMSPTINYSEGALFQMEHRDEREIVSSLLATGEVRELWRGSLP